MVISVLFSVFDSQMNKTNRNGDPFLYSLGISAKFLDKSAKLEEKKWVESALGPSINWDMNKNFGDIHPDYKDVNTKSFDRYSFRYLTQLLGYDGNAYMYYGNSTANNGGCKEDTLYIVLKNSRMISIEQDILLKLLLLKNTGSPKLDSIGFKNIPETSKTKGGDSIDLDPTAKY